MNHQELTAKLTAKGVKSAEIDAYLTGLGATAEDIDAKMIPGIVEEIIQSRPGAIATTGSDIAKSAPIAPVAPTKSAANRRPGRQLPVKRQERVTQQQQDQQAIAINYQEITAAEVESVGADLDQAAQEGQAVAQELTTAKTLATLEGLRQGNEAYHRVVGAAISAGAGASTSVSEAVAKVARQNVFNDEWLASLLG